MSDSKNRYVPVPTLRTGQSHPHPEPIGGGLFYGLRYFK